MTQDNADPGPPPIPPTPPRQFSYAQSLGPSKPSPLSPPVPLKPPTKQSTLDSISAPVDPAAFFGQAAGVPPPTSQSPKTINQPAPAQATDLVIPSEPSVPPKPKPNPWGAFRPATPVKPAEPVAPAPAPPPEPSHPDQPDQTAREQAPSPPPYDAQPPTRPPPVSAWSRGSGTALFSSAPAPALAPPFGGSGEDEVMIEHVEDTTDDQQPYVPQEVTDTFPSNLTSRLNQISDSPTDDSTRLGGDGYVPPLHDPWGGWEDSAHLRWAKKGWLATRMLSVQDEMGIAAEYLLPGQVWDFEVETSVPGDKYPHWGSWKLEDGTELSTGEVQMMFPPETQHRPAAAADIEMTETITQPSTDSPAAPASPARAEPSPLQGATETVSLAELRAARPHPSLYFNPVDRSWVLCASAPPRGNGADAGPSTVHNTWRPCEVPAPRVQKLAIPPPLQPARLPVEGVPGVGLGEVDFDLTGAMRQDLKVWEGVEGDDVVVSNAKFYPLVIREELWLALEQESAPKPGDSSTMVGFFRAVQMVWRVLDSLLFLGKRQALPVGGKTFSKAITWSETAAAIFVDTLGFIFHEGQKSISPPQIGTGTDEGRANRARLVRAWLEVGLMIESAKANDPASLPPNSTNPTRLVLISPQSAIKAALGGHEIPRRPAAVNEWTSVGAQSTALDPAVVEQYDILGATPDVSDEVIVGLYETQLSYHDAAGPVYLGALDKIAKTRGTEEVLTKVAMERSRGKLPQEEIDAAYAQLGAEQSWSEDQLVEAFTSGMDQAADNERKDELRAMFGLIARLRDSDLMRMILSSMEEVTKPQMTLAQAYLLLDLPEDTPDDSLEGAVEMMYSVMSTDVPADKLREAVLLIADTKKLGLAGLRRQWGVGEGGSSGGGDSMALVPFGQPKEDEPVLRVEGRPVGLTNIANTCYLNSLLQYLFNVRELREAILSFESVPEGEEDGEETEGVAERRVGGRLVTKEEVKRANRFVVLLQALFRQLVESSLASVTPETELAYLALVTGNATYSAAGTSGAGPAPDAASAASDGLPPLEAVTVRNNTPQPMDTDDSTPGLTTAMTAATDAPPGGATVDSDAESAKSPSVLGKRRSSALESVEQAGDSLDDLALASSPAASAKVGGEDGLAAAGGEVSEAAITPTIGSPTPTPEAGSEQAMELDDDAARVKRGKSTEVTTPPLLGVELPPVEQEGALAAGAEEAGETGALPVHGSAPPPLPVRPAQTPLDLEHEVSKAMAFGLQNDVTEAQDNVVFLIEASQGRNHKQAEAADRSVVKNTFYGKMKQILEFDDPSAVADPVRTTEVPFLSLGVRVPLDPPGVTSTRSLYDGLDTVFESTAVTSEGHDAQLRATLLETPPMLQIQLQRVDYDREARRVVKSNAHVAFPEVLSLDRYLDVDPADEAAVARQQATRAKRQELELARLRLEKLGRDSALTEADGLRELRAWLASDYIRGGAQPSAELDQWLADKADALDAEVVQLVQRLGEIKGEIADLWRDERRARFGLVAVFIHRGTASSGHYYVYLKNSEDGRWYKYNDATVGLVDKAEVFRQAGEGAVAKGDTNAYFLGYAKLGEGEEVEDEWVEAEAKGEEVKEDVKMDVREGPAEGPIDWTVETKALDGAEAQEAVDATW